MEVEGGYMLSWAPVPGQIGCQLQGRPVGGERTNRRIMGEDAGSFFQPMGGLEPATTYQWRVRCACAEDVRGPWSSVQTFTTPGEVVAIASQPNPTNGPSVVTFSSTVESYVTLEVYDMSGRLIDGIFAGNVQSNNEYRFEFDGTFLPNGVYIYRLTTDTEVINEKFMIAK